MRSLHRNRFEAWPVRRRETLINDAKRTMENAPRNDRSVSKAAAEAARSADSDRTFSFVAASRNDDHGGDLLRRTQSFINLLALQAERNRLRAELVLVDWNPPGSRAPLADVLDWPRVGEWFKAVVVVAPRAVHLTLPHARSLAMYQMIAKNVGIRRARGRYVIATNIDIIFSDELFTWLKTTDLEDGCLYRSDRWDIPSDVQLEPDVGRLLERAHAEAIRLNLKSGTFDRSAGVLTEPELKRVDHMLIHPIKTELLEIQRSVQAGRDPSEIIRRALEETLPEMRRFYLTPSLHLNGCGDFTMLSAASWRDLRGYPEWPVFSWNIDSILLIQAAMNGYVEAIAPPNCIHFHIEHSYGSGYTPGGADSLWRRLLQRSIPWLNWEDFRQLTLEMHDDVRQGARILFNDEGWGMADIDLPVQKKGSEVSITPARRRNSAPLREGFDSSGLHLERSPLLSARLADNAQMTLGWLDGAPVYNLVTPASPWAYALEIVRPLAITPGQSYWVRCWCGVTEGALSLGAVSYGGRRFVAEMNCLGPLDGWREIVLRVSDQGGNVILRTGDCGPCRVAVTDIDFFWAPPSSS
jgi:hypothetical protein